jgi:hypothetical protein
MILDPATQEAMRLGQGPVDSGPLFFSSPERLEEYARGEKIADYRPYAVPAGILARMKGKRYWLDGQCVEPAGRLRRTRDLPPGRKK